MSGVLGIGRCKQVAIPLTVSLLARVVPYSSESRHAATVLGSADVLHLDDPAALLRCWPSRRATYVPRPRGSCGHWQSLKDAANELWPGNIEVEPDNEVNS